MQRLCLPHFISWCPAWDSLPESKALYTIYTHHLPQPVWTPFICIRKTKCFIHLSWLNSSNFHLICKVNELVIVIEHIMTHRQKRVRKQLHRLGPLVRVMDQTPASKVLQLLTDWVRDLGCLPHPHFEHDLVVGVILCPRPLCTQCNNIIQSNIFKYL